MDIVNTTKADLYRDYLSIKRDHKQMGKAFERLQTELNETRDKLNSITITIRKIKAV